MAWFWTDDLAHRLMEAGVSERSLSDLLARPAAIAAADEKSALDVARRLAGLQQAETDAA